MIYAQEIPAAIEQQLENTNGDANSSVNSQQAEDDTYLQQLSGFSKNPLNLNTCTKEDLNEFVQFALLSSLQADNFLLYRNLFGKLISVYELQAVPGWDIAMIRRLLPFITITKAVSINEDWRQRISKGEHSLLARISQAFGMEDDNSRKYAGSPQRIFLRYKYSYKNLFQYGLTADKDAGEQLFKGSQKKGFDFYSVHAFARNRGGIRSLAIGDFTVNMGQGLIQWQSLAFKKGAEVMSIKRQSPVLRPYNSAGEFNFNRGAGATISIGRLEATAFVSLRKLSAGVETDTATHSSYFTSFQTSGYHRTLGEISDKSKLGQQSTGAVISYNRDQLHIGWNAVLYRFSLPLQKRNEPYNLFSITGNSWWNASVDYSYTRKNLHFFGETGMDRNFNLATINGLLLSIHPKVDLSVLYRNLSMRYQAVNGNAFTENSFPSNENGLYAGISIRPSVVWKWNGYINIYRFPWLKYQADAPSSGRDFFIQFLYTPAKQLEVYARYRNEAKQANETGGSAAHGLSFITKQNLRLHMSYVINSKITIRDRVEMVWYDRKANAETGFLGFSDFIYKPLLKPYSFILRMQYFETDGYDARLYAYENDVLYSYSIPVFNGKGYHCSVLLNYDINKKISCWLRWTCTFDTAIMKTELKWQLRYIF